jgi:hypothetical protein
MANAAPPARNPRIAIVLNTIVLRAGMRNRPRRLRRVNDTPRNYPW